MNEAAFHDFERQGWQRAAEFYGDAFGSVTSQAAGPLLDAAGVERGTRVLDVACGPGFIAGAAAERGAIATGLDFSSAMIAEARRRHPALTFQDGDAEQLPFDAGTFDAVVMNFGMLHLARPEAAAAEANRVLRPGGRYAFTVWAPPDQAVGFGMVLRAIEELGTMDVGLPPGPPFFQFSDPATTKATLGGAGFHDVEVDTIPIAWTLRSPDAVFDAISRGGVRTAAVLRAQKPDVLERIRAAVRAAAERYRRNDGSLVIPMPAVLSSARRAAVR